MSTQELAVSQPAQLAGLFDPKIEGVLTQNERELLGVLISTDERIDVAIPDDISDENLWEALQVCCKVESRVRKVQAILKMLVGRALILMQNRPEMYREKGFISLDALMSDEEKGLPAITGISRSELYNAKAIAKSFPTISMKDYGQIGFNKLLTLSKIRKQSDSDSAEWLEKAKTSTKDELEVAIYRSNNNIPVGSLEQDVLMLKVSLAEKREIEEFLKNPEFQAYCKSALPGIMLTQAIAESVTEWAIQIRAQQAS